MGNKSFFKPLAGTHDKRLRFKIATRKGKITEFLVQLEVYLNGTWKPAVRYDNSHGFAHRDVLDARGHEIEKHPLKLATIAEVLEYSEQDLTDRAQWYIERFLKTRSY